MNVIEFALQVEDEGEKIYRELAAKAKNPGIKQILLNLADDESKHHELITKVAQSIDPSSLETKILNTASIIFSQIYKNKNKIVDESSDIALYEKALEIEKENRDFFQNKSKEVKNEQERKIFTFLAREEAKHCFVLENVIEFVKAPNNWIEQAEFSDFTKQFVMAM